MEETNLPKITLYPCTLESERQHSAPFPVRDTRLSDHFQFRVGKQNSNVTVEKSGGHHCHQVTWLKQPWSAVGLSHASNQSESRTSVQSQENIRSTPTKRHVYKIPDQRCWKPWQLWKQDRLERLVRWLTVVWCPGQKRQKLVKCKRSFQFS